MDWFLARLSEPSTWAGIAVLVPGLERAVSTHDYGSIIQVVGGLLAAVIPEKSGSTDKSGAAAPPK